MCYIRRSDATGERGRRPTKTLKWKIPDGFTTLENECAGGR